MGGGPPGGGVIKGGMLRAIVLIFVLTSALAAPAGARGTGRPADPLPPGAIARYGSLRFRHAEEDRPEYDSVGLSDEETDRLGHPSVSARSGELLANPSADTRLEPGDELLVFATAQSFESVKALLLVTPDGEA